MDNRTKDQRASVECNMHEGGCSSDCPGHKWEIEPHPQESGATLVVDSDDEALEWLLQVAEQVWDDMEPGEERIIKIRCNKVAP